MKIKLILQSKTLWLAVLTATIGVLQAVPTEMLSQKEAGILTTILGILTFINRFTTTTILS